MQQLLQDVHFGLRSLGKSPAFTTIAIATLAIGIGANTAIFSFVDAVLLRPVPYADPDRIMRVLEKPPGGGRNGISTLNFLDWQKQNSVFEYMAAQSGGSPTLTGRSEPKQLRAGMVSAHFFDIFGIKAVLGRTFAEGEDQLGKDHVAILSHPMWSAQFGADPNIIGKSILLDGEPYSIIGVLPEGSAFDRAFNQIWLPLAFKPSNMTRNFHWFGSFAKLKRGVTLEQARAQMDAIGAQIARDFPDSNKGWGVNVERYSDILIGKEMRQSLYVLLAAVGMVLLIGCANLAGLTLARGTARQREVAIRSSLGAGRWRMVRQFLTESVLVSLAGGILGIVSGYATMSALKTALPPFTFPREIDIAMDTRVLAFAMLLSLLTGVVFGLAPALHATRANLATFLNESGRGSSAGRARQRARGALVVGEIALAFMLLAGAGLLIRSFFAMQGVDTGFDSTNVLTAGLPIADKRFPDPEQLNRYLREVKSNVEAVPGVASVALTSALPMEGWGYGMPFQIDGQPILDRAHRRSCFFKMVTPSYFTVLGIKLRRGRSLSDHDVKGAPPVTVINETMARKYFAKENPIGKRILIQEIVPGKTQLGPEIPWEVVGVMADEKVSDLDDKSDNPGLYVTNDQSPVYFAGLVIRTAISSDAVQQSIRKAVYAVNKDQTLTDVKTLDQIKEESTSPDRLRSLLLTVFAGIAMLLSAIGIYGVISYSVAQRTQEIGIRAALGATAGDVLKMILRGGIVMAAIGLALGFAGTLALTRLMEDILFGVGARDPLTIAAVAGILAGVAMLACFIPARRASKVDPLVALRYD